MCEHIFIIFIYLFTTTETCRKVYRMYGANITPQSTSLAGLSSSHLHLKLYSPTGKE